MVDLYQPDNPYLRLDSKYMDKQIDDPLIKNSDIMTSNLYLDTYSSNKMRQSGQSSMHSRNNSYLDEVL